MLARTKIQIRSGSDKDLEAVNQIVENCVRTWQIPERVKRLSMSSYLYSTIDLQHLDLLVAENPEADMTGVAAIEMAEPSDLPGNKSGLLLQGLYVAPDHQRQGIGEAYR